MYVIIENMKNSVEKMKENRKGFPLFNNIKFIYDAHYISWFKRDYNMVKIDP